MPGGPALALNTTAVADAAGDQVSLPAYYLWGHSIELSLKAFLFGCGVPLRKLKSKELGHNLEALVGEALRRNLKRVAHLNSREIGEIHLTPGMTSVIC